MATRLELQVVLEGLCERAYFQPPSNVQLEFPCILYERDRAQQSFADNASYAFWQSYELTVVSQDPDDPLFQQVLSLPMCAPDRSYVADGLNHEVFTLFF